MYNFFGLLSSGDGRVYCFYPEQRIAGVKMPNGGRCYFDYHTSIAEFYGLDEDECNKWEYNPFSDKLILDMQLTADDREAVLEEIEKIDFSLICEDIEGVREFIKHLKTMKFLDGHGDVPDDVKMFETMKEAESATWDDADDARNDAFNAAIIAALVSATVVALNAARSSVFDAAGVATRNAAGVATRNAAGVATRDATFDVSENVASDAELFTQLIYVCSGLPIDQKHIDYMKKRWSVWEAGYGVYCDVDGVLYCYKKA